MASHMNCYMQGVEFAEMRKMLGPIIRLKVRLMLVDATLVGLETCQTSWETPAWRSRHWPIHGFGSIGRTIQSSLRHAFPELRRQISEGGKLSFLRSFKRTAVLQVLTVQPQSQRKVYAQSLSLILHVHFSVS